MENLKKALTGKEIAEVIIINEDTVCIKFRKCVDTPKEKVKKVNRNTNGDIVIFRYSDRSFLVKGNDTIKYRDELRDLNGKWNRSLGGWIFGFKRLISVEKLLGIQISPSSL